MNFIRVLLVSVLMLVSTASFSAEETNSPECQYWGQQLMDIEQRLTTAKDDLKTCQTISECHDLKQLISSLKRERASVRIFIKDFCN